MKVVYKKSVTEQILNIKHQADLQLKQIDYIELNRREALQLYEETYDYCVYPWKIILVFSDEEKIQRIQESTIYGLTIKVNNVEGQCPYPVFREGNGFKNES